MNLLTFDCDGVLVDSEIISCGIDAECLTAAGFPTSVEEVTQNYVGVSMAEMLADIEDRHGKRLPDGFAETLRRRTLAAFDAELKVIPGIPALVRRLTAPRCVASSSDPDRIRHSLKLVDLLDDFEPHIFSAAMVERGKPAPDLFLLAAESMGCAPETCVVVEDSVAGVITARAAGMTTVGFVAGRHCDGEQSTRLTAAGASQVVSRSEQLQDVLDL